MSESKKYKCLSCGFVFTGHEETWDCFACGSERIIELDKGSIQD